jgi:hypothetical protein
VHEAGHALVARFLNVGVVEKVSILKRGRALGVTLVTNEQDATLQSAPELRAKFGVTARDIACPNWASVRPRIFPVPTAPPTTP